jgi:hypothetical protein
VVLKKWKEAFQDPEILVDGAGSREKQESVSGRILDIIVF